MSINGEKKEEEENPNPLLGISNPPVTKPGIKLTAEEYNHSSVANKRKVTNLRHGATYAAMIQLCDDNDGKAQFYIREGTVSCYLYYFVRNEPKYKMSRKGAVDDGWIKMTIKKRTEEEEEAAKAKAAKAQRAAKEKAQRAKEKQRAQPTTQISAVTKFPKDVCHMYLKTREMIPKNDSDLRKMLVENNLLDPVEKMQQPAKKKRKIPEASNSHLEGTEIGALLKKAEEQLRQKGSLEGLDDWAKGIDS
ncbi:MAG: hypothetical protein SGARI_000599 [Bacillariaceae sp.]